MQVGPLCLIGSLASNAWSRPSCDDPVDMRNESQSSSLSDHAMRLGDETSSENDTWRIELLMNYVFLESQHVS